MADPQDPKISAQNAKNTQDTAKATATTADKQKLLRDLVEETLFLQRDYASEVQKLGKNLGFGALQSAELKKSFKDTANYAKDLGINWINFNFFDSKIVSPNKFIRKIAWYHKFRTYLNTMNVSSF